MSDSCILPVEKTVSAATTIADVVLLLSLIIIILCTGEWVTKQHDII